MIDLIQRILKVFSDNRLWDEGIELIGSWCFMLYQKHCGIRSFPFKTLDIDFLIPIPYKSKHKVDLAGLLEPLGFRASFNADGSIFLWSPELRIDFLIPEKGSGTAHPKEIKNLGIKATSLRFLDILLKDPIEVEERGLKIKIPDPMAFAMHKILIAERRKDQTKKNKDIEQALYVFEAIPEQKAVDLYLTFPKPWRKTIMAVLEKALKDFPLHKETIERSLFALQIK